MNIKTMTEPETISQRIVPEFLYHVTPRKNLDKILAEGLFPDTKNSGICALRGKEQKQHWAKKYGMQPIFLTTDPKVVICTQAGEWWIREYDAVLLKVDTANLFLEDEFDYLKEKWNKQYTSYEAAIKAHPLGVHYICRHPISKEDIEVSLNSI